MTKKIFRSIFIVALVVLFASIGIAMSFLYDYYNDSQTERLRTELDFVAKKANSSGIGFFESFDSAVFRFTVIGPDGSVLYDTRADTDGMENHGEREEITEAFREGKGSSARYSSTLMEKTLYESVLLDSGHVLRISSSRLTVGAILIRMLPGIAAIILVSAAVALVLSHKMAQKITDPLMKLDREDRGETAEYPELVPVLNKLYTQHRQITAQMEELRRKSDEFDQIISSMTEGLVLLDEHGMILSINAFARSIFDVKKDVTGSDFLLIAPTEEINKAIWKALEGERSEYFYQKNGCEYRFSFNPIKSDGKIPGAVILVFDVTDRAFAERNRKEFTANVSHELKTPLQSIIGFSELLESGLVKPEDTGRFVSNIKSEAERLVSLINDIIRLSQLDEGGERPFEEVDLCEVAREVTELLSASAAKKQVELCLTGTPCTVNGVRRYLFEIVYNLCDNAIRYNREGGRVDITVKKADGKAVLSVTDTGIGIPAEHKTRIFERFYRVDKSHSRETGGTGLGLSIVKHAVAYHNGKVTLESEPGKGTAVTVLL